ncbi:uncharacterized protein LOC142151432 [Mixophyes fleayi]|uniref:uncharacterized protein LOC142151432 n=1 Tax=Mixophyes fleayi TaxID=3061075 RepID=UPI003F4DF1C0
MIDLLGPVPHHFFITPLPRDPTRRQAIQACVLSLLSQRVICRVPEGTGVLFKSVSGQEARWVLSTHLKPKEPQCALTGGQISDGIPEVGDKWLREGSVYGFHRHKRRIPPRSYLERPSVSPKIHSGVLPLSVSGSSLRPFHSAEGLHKDHVSDGSVSSPKGSSGRALFGRSAHQILLRDLLTIALIPHLGGSREPWVADKLKEIPGGSVSTHGLIMDTSQQKVFLPAEKIGSIRSITSQVLSSARPSIHLCMWLLGKMVAYFETIPFGRAHSRCIQWDLLTKWLGSHIRLDLQRISLSPRARESLQWWLN